MVMEHDLPRNTVIRLSQYRRLLEKYRYLDEPFIFSHDLARMLDLKAVKVRHDLMLLGISGDRRKGYSIHLLLEKINEKLDNANMNIILIGLGRLGMAVLSYLEDSYSMLQVSAIFDIDPAKINSTYNNIDCYSITELSAFVSKRGAATAILAVAGEDVNDILPVLLDAGIKGILNYSSEQLIVPDDVVVRNVDIISALEEINYLIPH